MTAPPNKMAIHPAMRSGTEDAYGGRPAITRSGFRLQPVFRGKSDSSPEELHPIPIFAAVVRLRP
jgi:hypothetical protein